VYVITYMIAVACINAVVYAYINAVAVWLLLMCMSVGFCRCVCWLQLNNSINPCT
jgi:hypothetical protein